MGSNPLKPQLFAIYLTIIPGARVGYEIIDSQQGGGYNNLISNKREWNNCFIKNNQEILLDFADFAMQEQLEDNLLVSISWVWYNEQLFHERALDMR